MRRRWYESVGLERIRLDTYNASEQGSSRRYVHELRSLVGLRVVRHCEVDVEQVDLQPMR